MVKGKTPRILLGFLVLVLVAMPLLVAACDNGDDDDVTPTPTVTPTVTPTPTPTPTATSALEDTTWILESYGALVNLEDVLTDTRITAEFVSSDGTIEGSAGCNSYFGGYEVEGSQLSIPGPIAATEMYCGDPEGVMEQEQQYLEILQAAESYSIEGEELRINCGDQVLIYAAETPTVTPTPTLTPPITSNGGPVTDYVSLVDNLRAAGATVNPAGEVEQPFFSVKGLVIKINDDDVQVFEYDDANATENEAKAISPDGSSIATFMPSWVAPPHFYKAEKLIVLYVGENEDTIGILDRVLGPQFAGRAPQVPSQAPPVPSNGLPLAPTSEEPPTMPPQIEVAIDGLAFNPATLNVPTGTTVLWYNNDSVTHTVTARDNLFDSGDLSPGDTFKYTFEQSGELEYYCRIHPSMVGKITIE
jgi:plastocyanin/heat shock protein HslJ